MGDVVNLQQYRKKLKRERSARKAAGNRARHGISRRERRGNEAIRERREKELEGKRLAPRPGEEETPSA